MSEASKTIAIEGPIGVGKSALATKVARALQAKLVLEEYTDNPFLRDFYQDRKKVAFQTQVYFLIARLKQQERLLQRELFHRTVVSDFLFEKDRIFAYLNLADDELQLYERIYDLVRPRGSKPDLVVYLQARPEVLLKRVRSRGRDYEASLDVAYLESLMRSYNNFFFHYSDTPLLVVETSEIDFVKNTDHFQQLLDVIKRQTHGTRHYVPKA